MRKGWRWKSVQSKPICKRTLRSARGVVGSYEKAPPEHRVDSPNPDGDRVSCGLRIVFHSGPAYPIDNASALPSPRFEMLSRVRASTIATWPADPGTSYCPAPPTSCPLARPILGAALRGTPSRLRE